MIFSLGLTTNFVVAQDTETITSEEVELDQDIQPADLEVSPPTILPDSPFYFLKSLGRGIRSLFTFDPIAKMELKEKFANEKLMELKEMIQREKSVQVIKKAAENYENEIETVKKLAERIKVTAQESEQVGTFLDKYIQHQALHQRVLCELEDQVPIEALQKIQESRNLHLEKFSEVMQKLEDKDKIPERLEKNLDLVKGSDFKHFINIDMVENLKEKLPEEIRIKIEEKQEEMLGKLHEKLEALPAEKLQNFIQYIKEIGGDKVQHLDIIGALEGKELSDKLRPIIESARNINLERIESDYENRITKQEAEAKIREAEILLEKITNIIIEKNTTIQEIPDAFRLTEEAEKKLALAKQEFDPAKFGEAKFGETEFGPANYTKAYTQATAAMSLTQNAIKVMEIRAGYQDNTTAGSLVCSDIIAPVCGKDGKTYRNICEAKKENVEVAYRGECKTNIVCAQEGERVNRNPVLGTTERRCCEGLEEVRISKSYSICKKPGTSFECKQDTDCPFSPCSISTSLHLECIQGKCAIPRCEEPMVCIQVMTPARNQATGECKTFSSPCDIPSGWIEDTSCGILQLKERIQTQLKIGTEIDQ